MERISIGDRRLTIKIVGGEQIVCDCKGDSPDKYVNLLMVGFITRKDSVTLEVHCPGCECCKHFIISVKLALSWTRSLESL